MIIERISGLKANTVVQDIAGGQNKILQSLTLRYMVAIVKPLICVTGPGFE